MEIFASVVSGMIAGAALATIFSNPVRAEIRTLTDRAHLAVSRVENAIARIEAKL